MFECPLWLWLVYGYSPGAGHLCWGLTFFVLPFCVTAAVFRQKFHYFEVTVFRSLKVKINVTFRHY